MCADVPHRKVYEPEKAVLDGLWSHPQAAQVVHFQHPQHPRPLPKLAGHTLLLPLTHKLLADCDPHISAKTYQLLHCMAVHARDQGREVQVIRDSLHVESAMNSAISNAGLAYSVYTAIFASLIRRSVARCADVYEHLVRRAPAGRLSAMTAICRRVRPRQGSLNEQASFLLCFLIGKFTWSLLSGVMILLAILKIFSCLAACATELALLAPCFGAILCQDYNQRSGTWTLLWNLRLEATAL